MARGLNDIVDALRRGRLYGRGCTLLIGAGCSKTAKIPLAGEIVDHIRTSGLYDRVYELALERAKRERPDAVVPTYGHCMEEMDRGDQRDHQKNDCVVKHDELPDVLAQTSDACAGQ